MTAARAPPAGPAHTGRRSEIVDSFGTDEIQRIVEQYSPSLLRLAASRLSPADAEDTLQEVFLTLLAKAPRFRNPGHEKAWLIRATLHRAADIRKAAEYRNLPLEEAVLPAAPEEDDSLLASVQALPDKYAAVIHLYYYEGYSMKEIAKTLGVPTATVGTRLARGRERLRQMLKEEV